MRIHDVIKHLVTASGPSRKLDGFIAKALGFTHLPKTDERAAYWVSLDGKEVKIPKYTFSFDAACRLAELFFPGGGASWDDKTGAARIGSGEYHVAATAQIAICAATLHALDKDANPIGKAVDHQDVRS